MVRDGIFYALGMLLVAAGLWWLGVPWLAVVPLLVAAFFLWFFRDPERSIPAGAGLIVSPADGKVTDISSTLLNGRPCTRISIFLNVFDVHVNRSPVAGVIKEIVYKRGQFGNADARQSERARQLPGHRARRIVGRTARRTDEEGFLRGGAGRQETGDGVQAGGG